jgi:Ca2+-dependent lipid-binding protein
MAILTVKLLQVTNLCDQDTLGKSDPFVKFNLEQDNLAFDKNFGDKKSTKKGGTVNPVYNETFTWEFPSNMGLNNLVLRCKVMDDDPIFDDKLGFCKIKLEDLALSETPLGIDRVVDNNIFTSDGRIYLELSYVA